MKKATTQSTQEKTQRNDIRQPRSSVRTSPVNAPTHREVTDVVAIVEQAQQQLVRSVNTHLVTTYWRIGERLVEAEQGAAALQREAVALGIKDATPASASSAKKRPKRSP